MDTKKSENIRSGMQIERKSLLLCNVCVQIYSLLVHLAQFLDFPYLKSIFFFFCAYTSRVHLTCNRLLSFKFKTRSILDQMCVKVELWEQPKWYLRCHVNNGVFSGLFFLQCELCITCTLKSAVYDMKLCLLIRSWIFFTRFALQLRRDYFSGDNISVLLIFSSIFL